MQQYRVVRIDDLDQSERDVEETVFKLGAEEYRLDLGPKSRRKLEKALEPFIDAARASSTVRAIRASTKPAAASQPRPAGAPSMSQQIREWAKAHDIDVPDRGRISKSIIEKYDEYEQNRSHVG